MEPKVPEGEPTKVECQFYKMGYKQILKEIA